MSGHLLSRPDGVGVLSVYGPITGDALGWLRTQVMTRTAKPLRAVCLRLDKAMVAFGRPCLDALSNERSLSISAAIVVAPALLPMLQAYAWQMAERGYTRMICTSFSEALAWTAAQSRLAQAQAEWRALQRVEHGLLIAA